MIYADPPYQYEFAHSHIKPVSEVYPTMSIAEICAMGRDIHKLSARNCTLLLWIPAPHLDKFPAILEAWGFRYCTCWVWCKQKPSFSHYGSISHEMIVVGGKGRSVPTCDPKTVQSVSSVQSIKRNGHSEKPKEYYEIIERLWPSGEYLELFSRAKERRK